MSIGWSNVTCFNKQVIGDEILGWWETSVCWLEILTLLPLMDLVLTKLSKSFKMKVRSVVYTNILFLWENELVNSKMTWGSVVHSSSDHSRSCPSLGVPRHGFRFLIYHWQCARQYNIMCALYVNTFCFSWRSQHLEPYHCDFPIQHWLG